MYRPGRGQLKR